jgi:hypothetical protein
MAAPTLKRQGVDGRVKHGHDGVGGWVFGHDGWYKTTSGPNVAYPVYQVAYQFCLSA